MSMYFNIPKIEEDVLNMNTEALWYLWKDYECGKILLSETVVNCVAKELTLRGF
jgi:hypothetical protein